MKVEYVFPQIHGAKIPGALLVATDLVTSLAMLSMVRPTSNRTMCVDIRELGFALEGAMKALVDCRKPEFSYSLRSTSGGQLHYRKILVSKELHHLLCPVPSYILPHLMPTIIGLHFFEEEGGMMFFLEQFSHILQLLHLMTMVILGELPNNL